MKKQVRNELLILLGLAATALYATRQKKAAFLAVAAGGFLVTQKGETDDFLGHSAVITGGSRGLGFALAKQLILQGANVSILARDEDELRKARQKLEEFALGRGDSGGSVHSIVCDVTDNASLEKALHEAAERFGGIDLLINNAGSITVGPWETMRQEDFEAQMKLHVYSVINSTRMVLPYLRRNNSGKRIVNICSMGGRMAVPHMVPYDTSKFALSGFSQGVGAELAGEGISVTTIYPALMRTGSPIQAVFKGDHEKEFAWFQAADVMPGLTMSADAAAQMIVEAARERRWELTPSIPAKLRMAAANFFPELMGKSMGLLNSLLPTGKSTEYKTGAQSRALFDRSEWTKPLVELAHDPEVDLNQTPTTDAKRNMGLLH